MTPSNNSSHCEGAYLPFDLLLSCVIPRLDERTIVSLRCVCRYFRSWISRNNPVFVAKYLSIKKYKPHLLLLSCRNVVDEHDYYKVVHGYTVNVDLEGAMQWHDKQEIFSIAFHDIYDFYQVMCSRAEYEICITDDNQCVHVYNITTKELVSLPEWHGDSSSVVGLGWTRHYREHKVVRFFGRPIFPGEPRCKIFTLKKDSKWRRLEDPPFVIATEYYRRGIPCINGVLYVIAEMDRGGIIDRQRILASFDVEQESFQILPTPPCCLTCDVRYLTNSRKRLTTLEGRLCMTDLCGGDTNGFGGTPATTLDLWTLMQGQEKLWIKQYTLDLSSSQNIHKHELARLDPLSFNGDGTLLYLKSSNFYCFYDFKSKNFSEVNVMKPSARERPIDSHFYDLDSFFPPGI